MPEIVVVVPCYNEAARLQGEEFLSFAEKNPSVEFIFVNDGSTDDTLLRLRNVADRSGGRCSVVDQQPNRGKAEAVRIGMLAAFSREPALAGYWDADLATPLDEVLRFATLFAEHPEREILIGARVNLLGREIRRSAVRHYLGRIFATVVSVALDLEVYDTQCGAKLFRVKPEIEGLFAEPFATNWIFDVEIIARLIRARRGTGLPPPRDAIYEVPLRRWCDVEGSKVKPSDFFRAIGDVSKIYRLYLR